ncbi:hypothetical protein TNCV_2748051 [Trichonephila clavipes]|nr:hypothetical protein TNCV_2748051 [Trichonephila clavipes]
MRRNHNVICVGLFSESVVRKSMSGEVVEERGFSLRNQSYLLLGGEMCATLDFSGIRGIEKKHSFRSSENFLGGKSNVGNGLCPPKSDDEIRSQELCVG